MFHSSDAWHAGSEEKISLFTLPAGVPGSHARPAAAGAAAEAGAALSCSSLAQIPAGAAAAADGAKLPNAAASRAVQYQLCRMQEPKHEQRGPAAGADLGVQLLTGETHEGSSSGSSSSESSCKQDGIMSNACCGVGEYVHGMQQQQLCLHDGQTNLQPLLQPEQAGEEEMMQEGDEALQQQQLSAWRSNPLLSQQQQQKLLLLIKQQQEQFMVGTQQGEQQQQLLELGQQQQRQRLGNLEAGQQEQQQQRLTQDEQQQLQQSFQQRFSSQQEEQEQLLLLPDMSCTLLGGTLSLEASEQLLGLGLSPAELAFLTQMTPRKFNTTTAAAKERQGVGLLSRGLGDNVSNTAALAVQEAAAYTEQREVQVERLGTSLQLAEAGCNPVDNTYDDSFANVEQDRGSHSSGSSVYSSICCRSNRSSMEAHYLADQARPWASSSVVGPLRADVSGRSADLLVLRHSTCNEEMRVLIPNQEASWGSGEASASCSSRCRVHATAVVAVEGPGVLMQSEVPGDGHLVAEVVLQYGIAGDNAGVQRAEFVCGRQQHDAEQAWVQQ